MVSKKTLALTACIVLAVALAAKPQAPEKPGSAFPATAEAGADPLFARLERLAPEDFSPKGPQQLYGTAENKFRDGSIFDYMDGGGVAYLEHGFVAMLHAEYAGQGDLAVALDVFAMDTAENALAALADERICPSGGVPPAFAPQGRAFRFPPDYYMYFPVDRHIVYLHVNDDRHGALLDRFAAEVRKTVEENPK